MHTVNTYISPDCTRKAVVYVDNNGHYQFESRLLTPSSTGWVHISTSRKFKHIESVLRAVNKWVK